MEKFEVFTKVPKEQAGWLETNLPKPIMKRLWSYIETAKKNPINVNNTLAGNISKSIAIEDKDNWFFETVLLQFCNKFMQDFPGYIPEVSVLSEDAPYKLNSFWVNFQKENEFNPPHDHTGVWSFVIWVKIPTDWEEQHALPFSANSNGPQASDFEFHYTTMLGRFGKHTYCLNQKSEGTLLFFPAKLMHSVYPFYNCDKERISLSGNIALDISENAMKQFRYQHRGEHKIL